eukprot:TRINITY_DN27909_c0_g1_i2.p1 TRINITY_DN27909_c0_g1~~TRINITY_DN27909_c0_g1_i2.p1  ORF type:complete len:154 (-),score=18.77 TRINITY_DN27909_c0_g1_i2:327-788(-)
MHVHRDTVVAAQREKRDAICNLRPNAWKFAQRSLDLRPVVELPVPQCVEIAASALFQQQRSSAFDVLYSVAESKLSQCCFRRSTQGFHSGKGIEFPPLVELLDMRKLAALSGAGGFAISRRRCCRRAGGSLTVVVDGSQICWHIAYFLAEPHP